MLYHFGVKSSDLLHAMSIPPWLLARLYLKILLQIVDDFHAIKAIELGKLESAFRKNRLFGLCAAYLLEMPILADRIAG